RCDTPTSCPLTTQSSGGSPRTTSRSQDPPARSTSPTPPAGTTTNSSPTSPFPSWSRPQRTERHDHRARGHTGNVLPRDRFCRGGEDREDQRDPKLHGWRIGPELLGHHDNQDECRHHGGNEQANESGVGGRVYRYRIGAIAIVSQDRIGHRSEHRCSQALTQKPGKHGAAGNGAAFGPPDGVLQSD